MTNRQKHAVALQWAARFRKGGSIEAARHNLQKALEAREAGL